MTSKGEYSSIKNTLSNIDIFAIKFELKKLLIDGYIDNIYHIEKETFVFKIRGKEKTYELIYENGVRLHITNYEIKKPKEPTAFCKMLRAFIRNSKLIDIEQKDLDRILIFHLSTKKGLMKLIFELFSFGNMILVDENNTIRLTLKKRKMKDRNIRIGEKYEFPPSKEYNILDINLENLKLFLDDMRNERIVRVLLNLNLGPEYINELLYRCKMDAKEKVEDLSDTKINCLLETIMWLRSVLLNCDFKPIVYVDDDNKPMHFAPLELLTFDKYEKKYFNTFNDAVDFYFSNRTIDIAVFKIKEEIEKEMQKISTIINEQKKLLDKYNDERENYERKGQLIYKYYPILEKMNESILNGIRKGFSKEIVKQKVNEFFNRKGIPIKITKFDKSQPVVHLVIEGNEISLNFRDKISKAASLFFEKAKKIEKKIEGVKETIEKYNKKLEELEKDRVERIEKEKLAKVTIRRVKSWFHKFRWFLSSSGILVVGGRDAKTNEILVKKYMGKEDIFMHADIHGAPVVIIKKEKEKEIDESTIIEAAQFAASYSKAWKAGLGSVDVFWVSSSQVSFTPPSGEYVAKGAFIIKGNRNYIKNVPLEISIGIILGKNTLENNKKEEHRIREIEIICGPTNSVKKRADIFCILIPGDLPKGKIAKKIKEFFETELYQRGIIAAIDEDDIINLLPPGSSRIVSCNVEFKKDRGDVVEKNS